MEVSYCDDRIRRLCEKDKEARRKLGSQSAKKLQNRLADLFAAKSVGELVAGRPHPLKGKQAGQFAVRLHGGHRLVFEPTDNPPQTRPDGGVDWLKVTCVRIIFIGDYHD